MDNPMGYPQFTQLCACEPTFSALAGLALRFGCCHPRGTKTLERLASNLCQRYSASAKRSKTAGEMTEKARGKNEKNDF
jgi:hypothetical protein